MLAAVGFYLCKGVAPHSRDLLPVSALKHKPSVSGLHLLLRGMTQESAFQQAAGQILKHSLRITAPMVLQARGF